MSKPPVQLNQNYYSLSTIGVEPKYYKVSGIGFPSQRGFGIQDVGPDGKKRFNFIDFGNNFNLTRKVNPSESGLPHPSQNIIAFRANTNDGKIVVQIFDLGKTQKLKDVRISGRFSFWKWVNETTVGLITNDSIYHLDITTGAQDSKKILQRRGNMLGCQIINYGLNDAGTYATISGIQQKDKGVTIDGATQLCLIQQGKQQQLNAYFGIFGKVKVRNGANKSTVYCYCERNPTTKANQLVMTEMTPPPAGSQKWKVQVNMAYPAGSEKDFPVFM